MNISYAYLFFVIALYAMCLGTAVYYVLRIRRMTTANRSMPDRLVAVVRDVVVLALLPLAASIVVFFLPTIGRAIFVGGNPVSASLYELAKFVGAQFVWSLPSACFYVLGTRLWGKRFTLRKVMLSALAAFAVCAIVVIVTGSAFPQLAAGLVAQIVAGILPLSVTSSFPPVVSIGVDGIWRGFGGTMPSITRAGCLCAGIVLAYAYLKHRLGDVGATA
jgi:hypothetical protein